MRVWRPTSASLQFRDGEKFVASGSRPFSARHTPPSGPQSMEFDTTIRGIRPLANPTGDLLHDFDTLLDSNGISLQQLYDVFDARRDPRGLNAPELAALMKTVMPGVLLTYKQLRYLMLVLDANGDGGVSLRDLRAVFRGFATAGYTLALRDEARLEDALMRLAQRTRAGLNLPRKFARFDALGKGWLHAHEVAALIKVALPGSTGPERDSMVLQSYDPCNGGVTFAGGNVTLQKLQSEMDSIADKAPRASTLSTTFWRYLDDNHAKPPGSCDTTTNKVLMPRAGAGVQTWSLI